MRHRAIWPLQRRSSRGFRGFPLATVAFYGPDDQQASKVTVEVITGDGVDVPPLVRHAVDVDVRDDELIADTIDAFLKAHDVKSVTLTEGVIGCPHEEGKDYPGGGQCTLCRFWMAREHWENLFPDEPARK